MTRDQMQCPIQCASGVVAKPMTGGLLCVRESLTRGGTDQCQIDGDWTQMAGRLMLEVRKVVRCVSQYTGQLRSAMRSKIMFPTVHCSAQYAKRMYTSRVREGYHGRLELTLQDGGLQKACACEKATAYYVTKWPGGGQELKLYAPF
ncbi:hypothetical protein PAXRUDRAFT_346996 [Paxillus rubicundulus Ve08.2h10]|uniref:Uncharacterized protein n=1 Tax=Paxillus rubicundulus Ve08.2h10 TaxID=930991 RepID=A0A0D0DRZ5_9AGAM|nr:hypothetical protein PAXRUDRAFT_346996 [Paxillus rubicundulus Ve08.2h10]